MILNFTTQYVCVCVFVYIYIYVVYIMFLSLYFTYETFYMDFMLFIYLLKNFVYVCIYIFIFPS